MENDIISYEIEKIYNELVLSGQVRLIKRDYPLSHLEDELTTSMAWEIHGLFGTLTRTDGLYRNSINGNYLLNLSTELKGKTPREIKGRLEDRLAKVRFGEGDYQGIQAVPVSVRQESGNANIQMEFVMPSMIRYVNMTRYLQGYKDKLEGRMSLSDSLNTRLG